MVYAQGSRAILEVCKPAPSLANPMVWLSAKTEKERGNPLVFRRTGRYAKQRELGEADGHTIGYIERGGGVWRLCQKMVVICNRSVVFF